MDKKIAKAGIAILLALIVIEIYALLEYEANYEGYYGVYDMDPRPTDVGGYLFGRCGTPCRGSDPCPQIYICTPKRALFVFPIIAELIAIYYLWKKIARQQ